MMSNVFAMAEVRGGEPRKIAFEAVTAARMIADLLGGDVHALLAGPPGIAQHAQALGEYGADVVLVAEHEGLAHYDPESLAATAAERIRGGYGAAVFGASAQGRDLAPRVAAKLGVPLAADVISIEREGETFVVRHPVYTGKVIATLELTATPALFSIRPNAFTAEKRSAAGRVEQLSLASEPGSSKVRVTDTSLGSSEQLDLGEAPVIISGGRGLKAPENFKLVEELAAAFGNAAVGATRAVTDEGWRPHSDQIGQTGRLVSPDLYVAVGISGAIQHLAGMRTSRVIVAINKDREAPIFRVADYGIVGDVFDIVPALTSAVKEAKRQG
jgi:electron transfer flavoprotein alpha subunit